MKALRTVWPHLVLALLAAGALVILVLRPFSLLPASRDFFPSPRPLGPAGTASGAVPDLIQALANSNPDVQQPALLGLLDAGSETIQALPALIALLREPDLGLEGDVAGVHPLAAYLLGKIGPGARAALPELTRILGDTNSLARHEAAVAVWRISRDPDLIVTELIGMLRSSDLRLQSTAVAVLRRIGREMALPRFQSENVDGAEQPGPASPAVDLGFAREVAFYRDQLEALNGVVAVRGDAGLPADTTTVSPLSEPWPLPDR